ncbi:unnamed protein product [Lactuca virosa]|uniref:Secreted protein n=1 Tax=Lactuca virosa TaxID=75947 RepID=A0AAU9MT00_9ASTR|nr:unnamed protein product [Lactuca virosa]
MSWTSLLVVEHLMLPVVAHIAFAGMILANSKPGPKCKRPIEKNQGCFVLVRDLIMVKEQVVFMHATVMRQQNKRECMMTQRNEERWLKTL